MVRAALSKGCGGCYRSSSYPTQANQTIRPRPNTIPRGSSRMSQRQDAWRRVVKTAIDNGIPTPAFSASLAYYDAYRRERLPANLIQDSLGRKLLIHRRQGSIA